MIELDNNVVHTFSPACFSRTVCVKLPQHKLPQHKPHMNGIPPYKVPQS